MRLHSVCVFVIRYIENGIEIAFGLSSFLCILRKSTKWYEIKIDVTKNTKKIYERERIMLTCSLFEFLFNLTISASHFVFLLLFFPWYFQTKTKMYTTRAVFCCCCQMRLQNCTYRSDQMDKSNEICFIPPVSPPLPPSYVFDFWKLFVYIHLECLYKFRFMVFDSLFSYSLSLSLNFGIRCTLQHNTAQCISVCLLVSCINFCFVSNEEFRLHLTPESPHIYIQFTYIVLVWGFGRTNASNIERTKVTAKRFHWDRIAIDAIAYLKISLT